MALIPRTECTYLALRRGYNRHRTNHGQFSHYRHAQTQLNGIRQKIDGVEVDRRQNKAFLRQTERSFNQVKDPNVIPFNLRLKKISKGS